MCIDLRCRRRGIDSTRPRAHEIARDGVGAADANQHEELQ